MIKSTINIKCLFSKYNQVKMNYWITTVTFMANTDKSYTFGHKNKFLPLIPL